MRNDGGSAPATEWIMVACKASAALKGGNREGNLAASMDFPAPGGPTISKLCPPAAAISSARLAVSWPFKSLKSGPVSDTGSARATGVDNS